MPEEWIEKTQQTLGSLITKPKLGEKYLIKPPFRFLHDALTETIRATGFGHGLYTEEELDAAKISEGGKQAKLDFLNKMVSCVSFALGEKLDVSANKIVAGLEPEKTNAFLVKLYDAATTKLDASPDAVMRVMQGETAIAEKKPKEKKDKPKEEAPPPAADDEEAKREEERKRKEEKKARAEAKAQAEAAKQAEKDAAAADAAKEEEKRRAKEEKKRKDEERRAKEAEEAKARAAEEKERRRREEDANRQQPVVAPPMDLPNEAPEEGMERTAVGAVPDSMRTRERPLTAGRKPPKITSKVKEQKEEPGMQAPVAQAPQLITEGMMGDEEDMFLAEEAPKPAEMLSAGGDQGKLVRELMQEKEKAIKEKEEPKEAAKESSGGGGIKMGKLRQPKTASASSYAEVDVEKLATLAQSLCQTVNPLGKSVDMIYQDIASMSKELDMWRSEHRNATERQQVEREATEKEMAPMHQKVAALDDKIAEKQAQITAIRARIHQNDLTIQNLLETIAYPGS